MGDEQILALYFARNEDAIRETAVKYGSYCLAIAHGILGDDGDSEECVNDTYLRAWKMIPPWRPARLSTFLGKITRNLALDRWRSRTADRRGGGQMMLALEELETCLPSCDSTEHVVDDLTLTAALERFLAQLSVETRRIFLRRYWYMSPISTIAAELGLSESKVKMVLLRARKKLKHDLEKEGIQI